MMDPYTPVRPVEDERTVEPVGPVERRDETVRSVEYRRDVAPVYGVSPAARLAQIVYLISGVVIALIIIRIVLKALAANPAAGFASFIYGITGPLVAPFQGLFATPQASTGSVFEFSSVVAIIVYALIAWAIVRLIAILAGRRTDTPAY